jgi:hypothetical protein
LNNKNKLFRFQSSPSAYSLSHRGNNAPKLTKRGNTTMKSIKTFVAVAALSLISFGTFAQSISASASTLDRAEAKIAAQAAEQGALTKSPARSSITACI